MERRRLFLPTHEYRVHNSDCYGLIKENNSQPSLRYPFPANLCYLCAPLGGRKAFRHAPSGCLPACQPACLHPGDGFLPTHGRPLGLRSHVDVFMSAGWQVGRLAWLLNGIGIALGKCRSEKPCFCGNYLPIPPSLIIIIYNFFKQTPIKIQNGIKSKFKSKLKSISRLEEKMEKC